MNEIAFPLTRTELLARGYLVDVTPVAEVAGVAIPIDRKLATILAMKLQRHVVRIPEAMRSICRPRLCIRVHTGCAWRWRTRMLVL